MARVEGAPLSRQLVIALVVPAAVVVAATAFLADRVAQNALERALGARLVAVAEAAGTLASKRLLVLEAGDDDSRQARREREKLEALRAATGVKRILIARLDGTVLIDTGDRKIGERYGRARFDEFELSRVAKNTAVASVLFTGPRGRPFKTGYAPFRADAEPVKTRVVEAFAAVEAPADYTEAISDLRAALAGVGFLGLALLLFAALWSARRVAVPLARLSQAAERVGAGDLSADIPISGPTEARILGRTMKQMTASLGARDEEMQLMLAGIAHEVRNPLGGIELFGGLLKEDLEGDPRQKHVRKILRELGTLSRVVNDFLDFARHHTPEMRPNLLADLALEIVALTEGDAAAAGVKLEVDIPRDLEVTADPESLRRGLLNLIRNGFQAAKSKVRLSASIVGSEVHIVVEDDGPGVPEDKRKDIFTPFFTTKQKGTGLGLALVQKTMRQHQGSIEVGDSGDGGARFLLRIPA